MQRAENGGILLHPGGEGVIRPQRGRPIGAAPPAPDTGSLQHHHQAVDGVAQVIKVLRVFERDDDDGSIVIVITHVENAGHGVIVRQNGFLIRFAASVLHLLQLSAANKWKRGRRRTDCRFAANSLPTNTPRPLKSNLPATMLLRQHAHVGFVAGIDAAHKRRGEGRLLAVRRLGFQQHRAEHERRDAAHVFVGRDQASSPGRNFPSFCRRRKSSGAR